MAQCWAHARRKLREVYDRDGSEIAAEGLRQIADLYAIEAETKSMCPGNRLAVRATLTFPWSQPSAIGWPHSVHVSPENPASARSSLTSPTTGRVCKHS